MKTLLALSILAASQAHAGHNCAQNAVNVAKENSRGSTLAGISKFDAGRNYLVGYDVAIVNRSNGNVDQFRIVLMASDCSIVSVTPAN